MLESYSLNQLMQPLQGDQRKPTVILLSSTLLVLSWAYFGSDVFFRQNLAAVLDLFIRKIVGWSIGNSLATTLVSEALRQAIELRGPDTKQLLHHSDRGCGHRREALVGTSDAYQTTLKTLGITCSMSRTGCCYDNAVRERFFWSLKHEWTKHESNADLGDARLSVFRYIENSTTRQAPPNLKLPLTRSIRTTTQ